MSGCVREPELEAALDGRLDPEAERLVLLHARSCLRCREARADFEQLARLAREALPAAPDAVRARRMRAAVMGVALMGAAPARARRPARLAWLAAAACVAALLGAVARARRAPTRAPALATRAAPAGPRPVDLAGAGTLWPAADARVLVRSAGADTRIELWQGEITMQVNRRRPGERFVVQLADAEVEVHGTRFTVAADGGRLARVDVAEGVVAVRHAGDPERMLAAGSHLLLPTPAVAVAEAPSAQGVPAGAAPRAQAPVDAGAWFREGSLAFAGGDHAGAERALGRFLAATPRSDPRREDARYLRVLSLHALARPEPLCREAAAYAREFPRGVRRAEVVLAEASSLAAAGRCDEAVRVGATLPDDAPTRLREALARTLRCDGDAPR